MTPAERSVRRQELLDDTRSTLRLVEGVLDDLGVPPLGGGAPPPCEVSTEGLLLALAWVRSEMDGAAVDRSASRRLEERLLRALSRGGVETPLV